MISFFKISWYLQIHLPHFPTHWSDGKAIHIILCHLRVVWKRAVWLHIQGEDSFWVTPVPIAASDLPLLLSILQGICARKLLGNEWQRGERAHQTASCVGSSPGKRLSWVWKNKTPNPNRIRRSHRSSYLWLMVPFFQVPLKPMLLCNSGQREERETNKGEKRQNVNVTWTVFLFPLTWQL